MLDFEKGRVLVLITVNLSIKFAREKSKPHSWLCLIKNYARVLT